MSVDRGVGASLRDLEVYWMLATRHPHVRTCVTLIADAVAAEGYQIVPIDGEAADDAGDPRVADIHDFMRVGFIGTTERAMRRALAIDVNAFGLTFLRKKRSDVVPSVVEGRAGLVGLERLDPRTVKIKPNADRTGIDSFLIQRRTGGTFIALQDYDVVAPADMIMISAVGGDPIVGMPSPLEGLDLTLAHDMAARRFREAFFRKGAKLGTVLINKSANKEQVDAVMMQVRDQKTGVDKAFDTLVATGDWDVANVARAGENDIDFVKGTQLNREDVSGVFKVPVGMIVFAGNALGSAGKAEDQDFFEQYAVLPLEEMLYEALTLHILRDEWGIEDLAFVPKRRNRVRLSRFDAAVKGVKFGLTGNDVRELVGFPKIEDPKFEMDTPLFIGSPTTGLAEAEPLETPPTPVTPSSEQHGGENADSSAEGAKRAREVAQKGKAGFRWTRKGGR